MKLLPNTITETPWFIYAVNKMVHLPELIRDLLDDVIDKLVLTLPLAALAKNENRKLTYKQTNLEELCHQFIEKHESRPPCTFHPIRRKLIAAHRNIERIVDEPRAYLKKEMFAGSH